MQPVINSGRETWSTRGFTTIDPEKQGVRVASLQRPVESGSQVLLAVKNARRAAVALRTEPAKGGRHH